MVQRQTNRHRRQTYTEKSDRDRAGVGDAGKMVQKAIAFIRGKRGTNIPNSPDILKSIKVNLFIYEINIESKTNKLY